MSTLPPEPQPARPEAAPGKQLNSWKEIAAHLSRSVPTVQRWEKQEGLPIHRHLHKSQGSVYAYTQELDAWWRERGVKLDHINEAVEPEVSADVAPAFVSKRQRLAIALVLALVIAAAAGIYHFRGTPDRPRQITLAVLPFENLSGDPEQEYFSDGFTEQLTTEIARLHPQQLKVIARTSVMRYKDSQKAVDEIGRELNADYILEGSVRRETDRVRISGQLIRVRDQSHVWAENYDRQLQHVLRLQSDVAGAIAAEIRIAITPQARRRRDQAQSVDPDAYEAYLKGRYWWNKRTGEGYSRAAEYFRQAIEKAPHYSVAYSGLADSYSTPAVKGLIEPDDAFRRAKAATTKALEIDDTLAEAHASLAYIATFYEWDWAAAEREFRRAIDLDPNYATAHHWYGALLGIVGRHNEALAAQQRALQLDPLSPIINRDLALRLYLDRRYDEAITRLQKTLEIDPDFAQAHMTLCNVYTQLAAFSEGIMHCQRAVELSQSDSPSLAGLGYAYAVAGKTTAARQVVNTLMKRAKRAYVAPVDIAKIHLALGDKDTSLLWLQRAYTGRSARLVYLNADPVFDPLQGDPRFQTLLRNMKLAG